MNDEPLIYTSKGNLPIASLACEVEWDIKPGHHIKLIERYRDGGGEVVKESAHVYSLQGLLAEASAANLGA